MTTTPSPTAPGVTARDARHERVGAADFTRQTAIVYRRQLRMNLRNPAWVIIGLMQPVLYLCLFGPLLAPMAEFLGTANAYTFFVPGVLVMQGIFGALFAGFSLVSEWRDGVLEAERVTPASRTALLLGRTLRDLTQLLVQGVVLIGLGFAFGMRGPLAAMLLGLVLMLLLGGACSTASNALALTTKDEGVLSSVLTSVSLPVMLLSGILLPISVATGAPQWLATVSDFVPTKYVVDSIRETFTGDFWNLTTLWGVIWTLILFVAGIWVGTRTFRRENA